VIIKWLFSHAPAARFPMMAGRINSFYGGAAEPEGISRRRGIEGRTSIPPRAPFPLPTPAEPRTFAAVQWPRSMKLVANLLRSPTAPTTRISVFGQTRRTYRSSDCRLENLDAIGHENAKRPNFPGWGRLQSSECLMSALPPTTEIPPKRTVYVSCIPKGGPAPNARPIENGRKPGC